MTATRPRRRLDPAERRLEVLEAAERVLRRLGANARVEDVVREAGAAKGTFYVCFPTWELMLAEVRRRIFDAFDRRFPVPAGPAVDWPALIETSAVGFIDFVLELEGLHEAVFHGSMALSVSMEPNTDASARIAGLLRAGTAAGALPPLDPGPTARLVFAMLHQAADEIAAGQDRSRVLSAMLVLLRRLLLTSPEDQAAP